MQAVYLGISKEHRAHMLASYRASLVLPDPHGKGFYAIDPMKDNEATKERKKKLAADKTKAMVAEYEAKISRMDEAREISGVRFKKGEPVTVADNSPLHARAIDRATKKPVGPSKLEALVADGVFRIVEDRPSAPQKKVG